MSIRYIAASMPLLVILGLAGCSSERELPVKGSEESTLQTGFLKGTVSNRLKIQGTGKSKPQRVGYARRP